MPDVIRSGPVRFATASRFGLPELAAPDSLGCTDGAICPQLPSRLDRVTGPPGESRPQSEDCLALSVVAPAAPGPHPVLVFVHGGAYITGSGLMAWFDGAAIAAEQNVVVVSVSYRLGPFGWLLLDDVSPGNLGLHDLLAALRWVHREIETFGGDPERVTIGGQSAGGSCVALLLEDPEARRLVRRAIVQSGAPLDALPHDGGDRARRSGRRLREVLGEDPTTCPAPALLTAANQVAGEESAARPPDPESLNLPPWSPVRGHPPLAAISAAPAAPDSLDVLVGWNRDELAAFGLPVPDAPGPSQRAIAEPWMRQARRWRHSGVNVRGYRLDWRPRGSAFGAAHCVELPLLLGDEAAWRRAPMLGDATWPDVDRVGRELRAAWAEFIRSGQIEPLLTPYAPVHWAVTGELEELRISA